MPAIPKIKKHNAKAITACCEKIAIKLAAIAGTKYCHDPYNALAEPRICLNGPIAPAKAIE